MPILPTPPTKTPAIDTNGRRAITFDFHNTLVHCDAWFELEVRSLVSSYLRWDGERRRDLPSPGLLVAVDAAYRRLRMAIMEHGNEESAEQCVAMVLGELAIPADQGSIAIGVESLMREAVTTATPTAGAVETVRALANAAVPLGVVSSAVYHPFLEWSLEELGILRCFGNVTTSASAGFYKSRPEIFWHSVEALGTEGTGVVHVGDSYRWDVGGAKSAGLRAVWINQRSEQTEMLEGPTPDLVLPSLVGAAAPLLHLLGDDSR